jgi:lipoic acid synthetase
MRVADAGQREIRKPAWLRRGIPTAPAHARLRSLLDAGRLHTVCQEARCPNCEECFARGTATFLILGDVCTRRCRFCTVSQGLPQPPDPDEPYRVAEAAARLALDYVVVTSVTRDDLADGGASLFAATIRVLKERLPEARVEVLIPDFKGEEEPLRTVLAARPDCLNHNLETVARLYPSVRPEADYDRSLALLKRASQRDSRSPIGVGGELCGNDYKMSETVAMVKSGMMLGLGETSGEVEEALRDLLAAGCRSLTLGQYLQPSKSSLSVVRFVPPGEFEHWREKALAMGFTRVASGPFVRSSYHAAEQDGINDFNAAGTH